MPFQIVELPASDDLRRRLPRYGVMEWDDCPVPRMHGLAYCHTHEDAIRVKAALEIAGRPITTGDSP